MASHVVGDGFQGAGRELLGDDDVDVLSCRRCWWELQAITRDAIQPISVHPVKKLSRPMAPALDFPRVAAMAHGSRYPKLTRVHIQAIAMCAPLVRWSVTGTTGPP